MYGTTFPTFESVFVAVSLVLYYTVKTPVLNKHQIGFITGPISNGVNLTPLRCYFNTFRYCFITLQCYFNTEKCKNNTAMVLNWHHSRLDLYWIQSGVNLTPEFLQCRAYRVQKRWHHKNFFFFFFFLDFSVLDTMYRWSMMKNIHSPSWVGIGSWGPRDMAAWIPN